MIKFKGLYFCKDNFIYIKININKFKDLDFDKIIFLNKYIIIIEFKTLNQSNYKL